MTKINKGITLLLLVILAIMFAGCGGPVGKFEDKSFVCKSRDKRIVFLFPEKPKDPVTGNENMLTTIDSYDDIFGVIKSDPYLKKLGLEGKVIIYCVEGPHRGTRGYVYEDDLQPITPASGNPVIIESLKAQIPDK